PWYWPDYSEAHVWIDIGVYAAELRTWKHFNDSLPANGSLVDRRVSIDSDLSIEDGGNYSLDVEFQSPDPPTRSAVVAWASVRTSEDSSAGFAFAQGTIQGSIPFTTITQDVNLIDLMIPGPVRVGVSPGIRGW